jgi:transglutaminase-like putative cysteine protease
MKTQSSIFFALFFLLFAWSCSESERHFLKDKNYRRQVHKQFQKRKTLAAHRNEALLSIFENEGLRSEQREALEFLYAYMPLCDLADYDGEFFLKQIDAAFEARDFFSWGKTVPEDIFRHFVLVYRVNNEYPDTARIVFFNELKDRVKNLSMYNAALEVNHWCHEKVTYRGTDSRTSAPLALVRTAWGRCGEESTFTVAALRSVGIPARQCYTPRWVHTDDNHAWVEVWIDGMWHYMGACEPEAELDVAWFTGPAKRTMMVHTQVFGYYTGPEEKNLETPLYAKINLLENYAETRTVKVQVADENGRPLEGVTVKFQVYNYAELYTIAESVTDKNGQTSIIFGLGDLMIYASNKDFYGYNKSTPQDEITQVKLDRKPGISYEADFIMNVPKEKPVKELSSEKIVANAIRLAYEDSLRNAYMATFISEENALQFAEENQLDNGKVWKYLHLAQGNGPEIRDFMLQEKDNPYLFPFLATLSEKDLRDTPAAYLCDHLPNPEKLQVKRSVSDNLFISCVSSPRIGQELIQPWRNFFRQTITASIIHGAPHAVSFLMNLVRDRVTIDETENYYNCRITPQGVYELQTADSRSRDIFFVALCRSFDIPARLEPATSRPQYLENGQWIDAVFGSDEIPANNLPPAHSKAHLRVQSAASNPIKPGYYSHYTLAYFKDGDFHTLDFEDNPSVAQFPYQLTLDEGYYRLTAGSRANDGSVFVHTEYFELKKDTPYTINVRLPEVEGKLPVKGIVDMNLIVDLHNHSKASLKALSKGKGLMLCFLDPGKEPSKHILQDFPSVQQALDEWKGGVLLMIPADKFLQTFDATVFKGLPQQTQWSTDDNRQLLKVVAGALQLDFRENFPLMVYLSRNGGILYASVGYRIATGEDVLKTIRLEASQNEQ